MTLTDRDRKIVKLLVPILVLVGYWMLLLSPKRNEAAEAGEQLAKEEKRRDATEARASRLDAAKQGFAADYAEFVSMGKAVPSSLDLPGLMVQLEHAAKGAGIRFKRVATPDGAAGSAGASGAGSGAKPAAPGGAAAQSAPGKTAEKAAGASGVQTAPLELEFSGGFFQLADFFTRLEEFVSIDRDRLVVTGRLVTVDAVKLSSDEESFPALKAEVKATVYLSPKPKGAAGGGSASPPPSASPAGPTPQTPASSR